MQVDKLSFVVGLAAFLGCGAATNEGVESTTGSSGTQNGSVTQGVATSSADATEVTGVDSSGPATSSSSDSSAGSGSSSGGSFDDDPHAYFDRIRGRTDAMYDNSWRTLEEIQSDTVKWGEGPVPPTYDAEIDASTNELVSSGSLNGKDQLRPEFDWITDGDVLFYWETRWDGAFPEQLEAFGIDNHKTFVLRQDSNDGEKRMLEIRNRYLHADAPQISTVDFRGYGGGWEFDGESAPLDGQLTEFVVAPDTWTRYWVYCNFDDRLVEVWIADEDRDPLKLLSKSFTDMSVGVRSVKFQFNSSQMRTGGEPVSVWNRNFVILRNLEDSADAIVNELVPIRG